MAEQRLTGLRRCIRICCPITTGAAIIVPPTRHVLQCRLLRTFEVRKGELSCHMLLLPPPH